MTASDCHPLAEAFLQENLRLNGLPPMKYRHGQWGAAPDSSALAGHEVQGEFDLIIGSDLLYERDPAGSLAAYIHLHATPLAEVFIVDPDRGNRPAFNREMADLGFGRVEHRLTHSLPVGAGTSSRYKGRLLAYRRR